MKQRLLACVGVFGLLTLCGTARAADPPAPRAGFQLALRTGYSLPLGKVWKGFPMSDLTTGQVPLLLDIGGKPIPELFLGAYIGFAFGKAAGVTKDVCEVGGGCATGSFRLGIEGHWHFLPGGWLDPWAGYGIGIESLAVGKSKDGTMDSYAVAGFEFAHFMLGADWRPERTVGLGPFVDVSLGKYRSVTTNSETDDIPNTALHSWITLGVRGVLFP
ncbi:MAG TPA: hypothetical protein VFQ35_12655 [Polyangiaceae bacterium]|nr:hypothetical protein [Polyangiaceae bacterium]